MSAIINANAPAAPVFANIQAAAAALTAGTIDKAALLAFARSRAVETEPLLRLMSIGKLSVQEVSDLLTVQRSFAAAPRQNGALSMKVSEKGALSVYGLQRMPVTLYAGQWRRLLAMAKEIEAFLETNKARLTEKPAKE